MFYWFLKTLIIAPFVNSVFRPWSKGDDNVPESGAAYAAAKAGVTQLTRFAAVAYADRNVRVNCIAPGVTPTAGYEKAGPEVAKMIIDRLVQYQPIKRTIDPSEQAAGILWLSSDESSMVTGHMLPIDGGWTAT